MSQTRKHIQESHEVNIRDIKRIRSTGDDIPVTNLEKEVTAAANRYQDESTKDDLSVEITTGICLLDINEDCLWKMFSLKYLGIMDLCALAETCSRLKGVAMENFRREVPSFGVFISLCPNDRHAVKYTVWYFGRKSVITIDEAKRIFFNFGAALSELKIRSTRSLNERTNQIMDSAMTYCSSLKSLILITCKIDESMVKGLLPLFNRLVKLHFDHVDMGGYCKDLLADCESLIELSVSDSNSSEDMPLWLEEVGENTFPKLIKFKYNFIDYYDREDYDDYVDDITYDWENFILRHKTLKAISLGHGNYNASLLPIIAENCEQLEILKIRSIFEKTSTVDYEKALKSLIKLGHLKVLKLNCNCQNVAKFIRELHLVNSLEILELLFAEDVFEFISDLSQLKTLKVLRLTECNEPKNLNLLGNLHRLTELKLDLLSSSDPDFDVVGMVERLINLETLEIWMSGFKIDKKTFLRIVDAVQGRPQIRRALALKCRKDFILDDDNCKIVKFLK